jgi:photosystem II stability/assembly factor-like uncharacterized protein
MLFLSLCSSFSLSHSLPAASPDIEYDNRSQAHTETTSWIQTNGPYGGQVRTIEIDRSNPDIMYAAGLGGGVFKSVDRGETWEMLTQIVSPNRFIDDVMISSRNSDTLYALAGQLYKSSDGGESWRSLKIGGLTCAAMSGVNPLVVAAGSWEGRVYHSSNGGESWVEITGNLPWHRITDIIIAGNDELWAGMRDSDVGQLYHTTNRGATWTEVDIGHPAHTYIGSIFIDPEDQDTICVGLGHMYNIMFDSRRHQYLFHSRDGGTTWSSLTLPRTDADVKILGKDTVSNVLYVGSGASVFKSTDDGQHWIEITPPENAADGASDMAIDPRDGNKLFLPTPFRGGIYRSYDGGASWTKVTKGLLNVAISLLTVPSISGSGTVYATSAGGEGTFKTADWGKTWSYINEGGITHPWADEIVVSPIAPNTVWEVSDTAEAFKSQDGGATWGRIINSRSNGKGFRFGSVSALVTAPSDANIIYAVKDGFGIYKSFDGGDRWHFLHRSEVDYTYTVAVHPDNPDIVFSGYNPKPFQDWAMVRRSEDGGSTWETVLEVPGSSGITSVAMDRNNPDIVYAGSTGKEGAIWTSENGGDTWRRLNSGFNFTNIHVMAVDPHDSMVAYVGVWGGGTFKTSDGGQSWTRLRNDPTLSASAILIDPRDSNTIFLADRTTPRIFRTTDGGNHWEVYFDAGAQYYRVMTAAFAPSNPDILYASVFSYGGPESPMSGDTFRLQQGVTEKVGGALPRLPVAITVDPNNENTVYAVLHGYGVYQTIDAGQTWTELSGMGSGLPESPAPGFNCLVIDPEDSNILYLLGGCDVDLNLQHTGVEPGLMNTVYRSTDRGATWANLNDGTLGENSGQVKGLAIATGNSDTLYIGTVNGVYRSNNGGASWTDIGSGLRYSTTAGVALSKDGGTLYVPTLGGGVFTGRIEKSTEKLTWNEYTNMAVPIYNVQVAVHPSDSKTIYASAYPGGIFKSTDGGTTWAECNFGMASFEIDDPNRQGYYAFAISPSEPHILYLGLYGVGVYKSVDDGGTWMPINGHVMRGQHITALVIDPVDTDIVYVTTESGVYRTADGGITWDKFSDGLDTTQIRRLEMTTSGKLLCGTLGYELYEYDQRFTQWRQMKAFDNFGTFWPIWNERPLYQYTSLLFHPTDPDIIYFGTFPAGIYRSDDGGESWRESNVGWTNDGVFSLVFHPDDPNIIYAGTYNGLNRSLDAGAYWEMCDNGWPDEQWVFSIDFDPRDPDVMYACSKNGENEGTGREGFRGTVMKTTDGGASWFEITEGLDINQEFYKIIVDRWDPDVLYLATQNKGVFISYDAGAQWREWNEGLTNPFAGTNGNNVTNTLVLSADGQHLYFGSAGSGVFRRPTIKNTNPAIEVVPPFHGFSRLHPGSTTFSATFTVANVGTEELEIGALSISGTDVDEFMLQEDNCSGQTIPPLETRTVEVVLSPSSEGLKNAVLSIPSDDPRNPTLEIQLEGGGDTENASNVENPGTTPGEEGPAPKSYAIPELEGKVVFSDDFENGTANWRMEQGWELEVTSAGTVLRGEGHKWAVLEDQSWDDYIFEGRVRLVQGGVHFNYRRRVSGEHQRYFIGVTRKNLYLNKQAGDKFYDLVNEPLILNDEWHKIKVSGHEGLINVYLDEKLLIEFEDDSPILSGGIAFETLESSLCFIDDVTIRQSADTGIATTLPAPAADNAETQRQREATDEGQGTRKWDFKSLLPYLAAGGLIVAAATWVLFHRRSRRNVTR